MKSTATHLIGQFALLTILMLGWLTLPAEAQSAGKSYRQFPALGFEFKPLKDTSDVPVIDRLKSRGVVGQFQAERGPMIKFPEHQILQYKPKMKVVYIEPEGPTTGGGKQLSREKDDRSSPKDFIKTFYSGSVPDDLETETDEFKISKSIMAERGLIVTTLDTTAGKMPIVFDVYTIVDGFAKAIFIWEYPADDKIRKKWSKAVEKSMKTFRMMKKGATTEVVKEVNSESSYEDLLAFHKNDVEQTPGWRLVESPKKQYLIKTNSDKDKHIDGVIQRLEASRKLYEKDFPPTKVISSVSVVRVCATEGDFHTYGQTGGGVAGWFNPRSEELVLYFGEDGGASTLSVMAHEGFHQYCHFLFDRAAAHRWFDEGHGDYYGAFKMKGKKLIPNEDMKGGLARLPEIKTMMRNGDIAPLSEHVRYDHGSWQSQGPSNVSCYAQSFSLVYFLRQGALKKVKGKYWKKEYADILPNYMSQLNSGFQEIYAEIRKEGQDAKDRMDKLDPEDVDPDDMDRAMKQINSPWDYSRSKNVEIWEAATAASWGQIDEEEFEERWLAYVDDVL
ncbi:MAG: hypothetical protein ACI8X5_002763 [Planctomycetota bacterium]|jgi:hypothetical protein